MMRTTERIVCETEVSVKEHRGIPRIHLLRKCGDVASGISMPLERLNPMAAAELLERKDVVFADRESYKALEKYLRAWL